MPKIHQPTNLYVTRTAEHTSELAALEMRTLFGLEPEGPIFMTDVTHDPSISPFIKCRLKIMATGSDLEELSMFVKGVGEENTSFALSYIQVAGDETRRPQRQEACGVLAQYMIGPMDLDNPCDTYGIIPFAGQWYFGRLYENDGSFRKFMDKPYPSSMSLPVDISRVMANLAGCGKPGARVADICSGVGTVVLEGLDAGYAMSGYDVSPVAVNRSRGNLEHYGLPNVINEISCAQVNQRFDAVVVDMPYGIFCKTTDANRDAIFDAAARLAPRAVFVHSFDITEDLKAHGLKIVDFSIAAPGRKGAAFVRGIWVCDTRGRELGLRERGQADELWLKSSARRWLEEKREGDTTLTMADALEAIARQKGFANWTEVSGRDGQTSAWEDTVDNLGGVVGRDKDNNVVSLILQGRGVTDADLWILEGLDHLKRLELERTSVTDAGLEAISKLTNLEQLLLTKTLIGDGIFEAVQSMPHLWGLSLGRSAVTGKGVGALANLPHLANLVLNSTPFDAQYTGELARVTSLKNLFMMYCGITDEQAGKLTALTQLDTLDVSRNHDLGDKGVRDLARLSSLTRVSFNRCPITVEGVSALIDQGHITQMDLNGIRLGDEVVEVLLKSLVLKRVGLHNTNVSDAGRARLEEYMVVR